MILLVYHAKLIYAITYNDFCEVNLVPTTNYDNQVFYYFNFFQAKSRQP